MFDQPEKEGEVQETIVGADVNLTGDLNSQGDITIRGKIKGQVRTKNSAFINEGAVVEGSVEGQNIVIDGTIKGNINAKEDLEINPAGKVYGDIEAKALIIKKGAIFVGNSKSLDEKTEPVKSKEVKEEKK